MDGSFTFEPYTVYSPELQMLANIETNTETTADVSEAFMQDVRQQFLYEQSCAAVQIFLLAAVFGAICARGLFKW